MEAIKVIKPKVAIPMHYGAGVVGTKSDAEKVKKELEGETEVRILKKTS